MMVNYTDVEDAWVHDTFEDEMPSTSQSHNKNTIEREQEESSAHSESLYQRYGTNEPYIKPENVGYSWSPELLFE